MFRKLILALLVAGAAQVARADTLAGGGGGSSSLVGGSTPITGTCTSGFFLENNAGVLACVGSSSSITFPQAVTGGVSGGIPYFSSTTVLSASALLTANALVIGGGAGTAPATTTTGTGVITAVGINTNASGGLLTSPVSLTAASANVTGNLPVGNLNSGTGASSTTFWRGDATWATPSGGTTVLGPAYQASRWYRETGASPTAGAALSITTTYCYPYTSRATFTTNAVGVDISAFGTSTFQVALYNDSGGLPSTLIQNSAGVVDTATGAISAALTSTQITGPAVIWKCLQAGDVTVRFLSNAPGGGAGVDSIGSGALGNSISVAGNVTGKSTPGTFGTWPASLVGNTWTDVTTAIMATMAIFVVSSP